MNKFAILSRVLQLGAVGERGAVGRRRRGGRIAESGAIKNGHRPVHGIAKKGIWVIVGTRDETISSAARTQRSPLAGRRLADGAAVDVCNFRYQRLVDTDALIADNTWMATP
ncbi:hypothetical protein EVAR_6661_1 [Eumeta japonica]|uniref:Uncharacterized protein n=1 Tax=Eumeta variegata TaxID=151549 RepID=A0A4C1TN80_EUMVA|nr:hypothetical protein EVAR_6661_1 [Eumeta japonica]